MSTVWTEADRAKMRPANLAVLMAIQGEGWITLPKLASKVGMKNPSTVASRLRDFAASAENPSKEKAWVYHKRKVDGQWEYLLVERPADGQEILPLGNPAGFELVEGA